MKPVSEDAFCIHLNMYLDCMSEFIHILNYGEGEIHFRVITADTGTSRMVKGM